MTFYVILLILLAVAEPLYIRLATHMRIGVEYQLGTRRVFTPVGGGCIFFAAAIAAIFAHGIPGPYMLTVAAGATVLAVMSFTDDIVRLSPRLRLVAQTVAMGLILWLLPFDGHIDLYILALIGCVGYINSSNFMDGSNGMLTAYSAVVLLSLAFLPLSALMQRTLISLLLAAAVFAFFNFRRKALVFSGDVGSITMGFFIAVALATLMVGTGNLSMYIFVIVFMLDTFCTFVQRLLNGERVLHPHRKHLYQLLIRAGYPQLGVAGCYAAIQGAVSAGWYAVPAHTQNVYSLACTLTLLTVYVWLKLHVNSIIKKSHK